MTHISAKEAAKRKQRLADAKLSISLLSAYCTIQELTAYHWRLHIQNTAPDACYVDYWPSTGRVLASWQDNSRVMSVAGVIQFVRGKFYEERNKAAISGMPPDEPH